MLMLAGMIMLASWPALPPKDPLPVVPGYDWMSPRRRARGEPAPPPVPAEKVVSDFITYEDNNPAVDAAAKSFIHEQREKLDAEGLPDFINGACSIISPDFKQGLELSDADRTPEAADVFEKLSNSPDPYLSVAAANLGATALIDLDLIDRCQMMLQDVADRHKPIENYTTASDHFRFMLGYCQVQNLEYEDAFATFEDFLKNHPDAPERLRTTATQIMTELSRRTPGRIGDVRDLLSYVRRKIKTGSTDDGVLDRQGEAVAILEDLIEEAEQQEKNQGQGDGQGGGTGRGRSQGQKPGGGAKESTLPTGPGHVGKLRGKVATPGEMWGKMPPREREQILQTLQKQFPSQYRELLEQYYKQLSKDATQP